MIRVWSLWYVIFLFGTSAGAVTHDELLAAISHDVATTRSISFGERLIWTTPTLPIALSDRLRLSRLVEAAPGISRPGIAEVTDYALRYGSPLMGSLEADGSQRARKYQRLLQVQVGCPRIKGSSTSRARRCRLIDAYTIYRDRWANALAAREAASADNIAEMATKLDSAKRDWDIHGYRMVVSVALANLAAFYNSSPALLWDALEQQFLEEGGAAFRVLNIRPELQYVPSLDSIIRGSQSFTSSVTLRHTNGNTTTVPYYVVRIRRPWLDSNLFWQYKWNWHRSAPFGQSYRIPKSSCTLADSIPCLSEWLIVVDSVPFASHFGGPTANGPHVIGVVWEPLPNAPFVGGGFGEEMVRRHGSLHHLIDRLRTGTF